MINQVYFLDQDVSLVVTILISVIFAAIGILYSTKHQGLQNYLTANRNIGLHTLWRFKGFNFNG